MDESDVDEFDQFVERNWGSQIKKEKVGATSGTKKRRKIQE